MNYQLVFVIALISVVHFSVASASQDHSNQPWESEVARADEEDEEGAWNEDDDFQPRERRLAPEPRGYHVVPGSRGSEVTIPGSEGSEVSILPRFPPAPSDLFRADEPRQMYPRSESNFNMRRPLSPHRDMFGSSSGRTPGSSFASKTMTILSGIVRQATEIEHQKRLIDREQMTVDEGEETIRQMQELLESEKAKVEEDRVQIRLAADRLAADAHDVSSEMEGNQTATASRTASATALTTAPATAPTTTTAAATTAPTKPSFRQSRRHKRHVNPFRAFD